MAVKHLLVRDSQAPPLPVQPAGEAPSAALRPLPPQQAAAALLPLTPREKWGYVFWGSLATLILVTEAIAAFWNDFPIPTISGTTGHLEHEHNWVKLIVLGGIVILATRTIFYPWPYRRLDD
jgi:hypothetical protein